jgi:hypothetical protein
MTLETLPPKIVVEKLNRLRDELVELAFQLDQRGRPEAADVALATSGRIAELCAELESGE